MTNEKIKNKWMRKFAGIAVLALALLVLLPVRAQAAGVKKYELYVDGKQVTSRNLSGKGWSYKGNDKKGTLTLNGAKITKTVYTNNAWGKGSKPANIYSRIKNLTLVLKGNNTITSKNAENGICLKGDSKLTIKGTGKLTISGQQNGIGSGIDSLQIVMEGGTVTTNCIVGGISCDKLTVNKGKLTCTSKKYFPISVTSSSNFKGKAGLYINGGTVKATGPAYGILTTYCDIVIKGGKVTATATTLDDSSDGLASNQGDIIIRGGQVTAKGNQYGICGGSNVKISGGTVNAPGGIYADWAPGNVTITGGNVTANAPEGYEAISSGVGKLTLGPAVTIKTPKGGRAGEKSILDSDGKVASSVVLKGSK